MVLLNAAPIQLRPARQGREVLVFYREVLLCPHLARAVHGGRVRVEAVEAVVGVAVAAVPTGRGNDPRASQHWEAIARVERGSAGP